MRSRVITYVHQFKYSFLSSQGGVVATAAMLSRPGDLEAGGKIKHVKFRGLMSGFETKDITEETKNELQKQKEQKMSEISTSAKW